MSKINDKCKCIIIHNHDRIKYYLYHGVIRYYCNEYENVIYYCRYDMIELITFMYRDLTNLKVTGFDHKKSKSEVYAFNRILKEHKDGCIITFNEYDVLRKDENRNIHKTRINELNTLEEVCNIYKLDYDKLKDNVKLERDLITETNYLNSVKKLLNINYVIITDDKYKSIPTDSIKMNILKLFPKNQNLFYYLKLLENANYILLGDDEIALILYMLQRYTSFTLNKKVFFYFTDDSQKTKFKDMESKKWIFKSF